MKDLIGMASPTSHPQDLAHLIGQAEQEARRKAQPATPPPPKTSAGRARVWKRVATGAAVVVAVAVWVHALGGRVLDRDRIARDLQTLLHQAQAQVEEHQQRHGTLPAVLPDVTLATVVSYRVEDASSTPPRYTLVAKMRDVEARGPVTAAGAKP